MDVQLTIPDDIVIKLQPPDGDLARWLLEMIALDGYKSEKLTAYQIQEMLGFETRMEVEGFLKAHGVPLEFTREDLERQRATFKASPDNGSRPFGLCAGEFIVPDDFDDPLPEEIMQDFEADSADATAAGYAHLSLVHQRRRALPGNMRDAIRDPGNEAYLSVGSLWEAITKYKLGKLPLPHPPEGYLPLQRKRHLIVDLPLDEASVAQLAQLPAIHRDPFDRMLICQALEHGMTMVTVDGTIPAYPVAIFK